MKDKEGSKRRLEVWFAEHGKAIPTDTGLWVRADFDELFEHLWLEMTRIDDLAFRRGKKVKTKLKEPSNE